LPLPPAVAPPAAAPPAAPDVPPWLVALPLLPLEPPGWASSFELQESAKVLARAHSTIVPAASAIARVRLRIATHSNTLC